MQLTETHTLVYPIVTDDKTEIWDEHDHQNVISDKIRKECKEAFDHVDINDIETIINEYTAARLRHEQGHEKY